MTARQANLLGALSVAIADRVRDRAEQEAGRGGQAPAALALLVQNDGLGIEGLRARLGLSQPATVRLVDALEVDGLAMRRPGADARSLVIELTPTGRRRAEAVLGGRRAVLDEALRRLPAAERRTLEALLETVLASLSARRDDAEVVCRLCDTAACRRSRCPVRRSG